MLLLLHTALPGNDGNEENSRSDGVDIVAVRCIPHRGFHNVGEKKHPQASPDKCLRRCKQIFGSWLTSQSRWLIAATEQTFGCSHRAGS